MAVVQTGTFVFPPVASHDASDFDRRLRESQRAVYQIAYGVLGNDADAQDVCQDVFIRAYANLRSLRDPERFRAWVARTSLRLALNHRRAAERARRRNEVWSANALAPAASAESEVAARDLQRRLRDEIQRLPGKLRDALLLCAVDGLDAGHASRILRVPAGTVRSRLHAARKQMLAASAVLGIACIVWAALVFVAPKNQRAQTTLAPAGIALSQWRAPSDVLLQHK